MRKIRLRITCHIGQYLCSYIFSVINMQRTTTVLVNYLELWWYNLFSVFKAFLSLSSVYIITTVILLCSVDFVCAEFSLQLAGLVQ